MPVTEAKYFVSLTMYDLTNNLVPNPIDRWATGSMARGLPDGRRRVVFRIYVPGPKIVDQTWKMPQLEKTK